MDHRANSNAVTRREVPVSPPACSLPNGKLNPRCLRPVWRRFRAKRGKPIVLSVRGTRVSVFPLLVREEVQEVEVELRLTAPQCGTRLVVDLVEDLVVNLALGRGNPTRDDVPEMHPSRGPFEVFLLRLLVDEVPLNVFLRREVLLRANWVEVHPTSSVPSLAVKRRRMLRKMLMISRKSLLTKI